MAKLITNHDPFHVHKTLGVLVLTNFIYRFYLCLVRGYAFVTFNQQQENPSLGISDQDLWLDAAGVLLHGVLSWSSLLLPLPKNRNYSSPMIWPEFRLHSILFASRTVVGAIVGILGLWPQHWLANYLSKVGLVFLVGYLANRITEACGEFDRRTTNAMPYPPTVTPELQRGIKKNYAMAQFTATLTVISEDPNIAFFNLLAIQGAPLLMTLVRKGKITSLTYHKIYIYQLALPMYVLLFAYAYHGMPHEAAVAFAILVLHVVLVTLRFAGYSKYLVWTLGVFLFKTANASPVHDWLVQLHSSPQGVGLVVAIYVLYTVWRSRPYEPILAAKNSSGETKSSSPPSHSKKPTTNILSWLPFSLRRSTKVMKSV